MNCVIDASAVLAFLFRERGAEAAALAAKGSLLSTVNAIEVLQRFARAPGGIQKIAGQLRRVEITVVPFDAEQAAVAADLEPRCFRKDISLADRCCMALGIARNLPLVTADSKWLTLDLPVDIRLIR